MGREKRGRGLVVGRFEDSGGRKKAVEGVGLM